MGSNASARSDASSDRGLLGALDALLDQPDAPLAPLLLNTLSPLLPADSWAFCDVVNLPLKRGGAAWAAERFHAGQDVYLASMPRGVHFRQLGRLASTHRELFSAEVWDRLPFVAEILRRQKMTSQLVIAVREGQRVRGALYLSRRGPVARFDARDLAYASRLGRHLSATLQERVSLRLDETLGTMSGREGSIAEHVANGLRNREIAEVLSISPHTVANHLRHIFAKVGVGSRTELASLLAGRPARAVTPVPSALPTIKIRPR